MSVFVKILKLSVLGSQKVKNKKNFVWSTNMSTISRKKIKITSAILSVDLLYNTLFYVIWHTFHQILYNLIWNAIPLPRLKHIQIH